MTKALLATQATAATPTTFCKEHALCREMLDIGQPSYDGGTKQLAASEMQL
jgi:hypothetical protein